MSLQMQAHLLRFLESGEIQPVGSEGSPVRVDVRIISATNRDLDHLVATGAFRSDLLYRIKVVHIHVPPLRERKEDLPTLIECGRRADRPADSLHRRGDAGAGRYRWPGNVRELQNVIEQAAWMSESPEVDASDLPEAVRLASTDGLMPRRERRRRLADDLYSTLVDGHYTFWGHIHPLLLKRDITRHDLRQLVSLGLATTRGNYRALLEALRHARGRLQALHELPGGARVHRRLPRVPRAGADASDGAPISVRLRSKLTDRHGSSARSRSCVFLQPDPDEPRRAGCFATPAISDRGATHRNSVRPQAATEACSGARVSPPAAR